ncbi:hypothetical protein F8S13_17600 [Chloroflexia bacterium SDU3-3]|nr:hypothetical protein F8S13_17600 [Chloroflexia bacterium SDU3-3]
MDDRTSLEFPRSGATTVAFAFEPQLLRCKAVGPGGTPLWVLIDTGTDPSALDVRLARRLALPVGGSGQGYSASTVVAFTETTLPWLRLGDLTIRNLFAPALDLSFFPFPVDVVLGYNVLHQLALHIDYAQRQLTLLHPELGVGALGGAARVLPLVFAEHLPGLQGLELDGVALPIAAIDTGSNGDLSMGAAAAALLGIGAPPDAQPCEAIDFGGRREIAVRPSGVVRLGPWALHDVVVDAQVGGGCAAGGAGRVTIGNGLLSRFRRVALDYERALLALEPRP